MICTIFAPAKVQGRSSAGLERFSHIEEVIGSNPIVPTLFQISLSNEVLLTNRR